MKEEQEFRRFLAEGGRSASAVNRTVRITSEFEEYLAGLVPPLGLDEADPAHLESFVARVESEPGSTANVHLWGLHYYYEFLEDAVMEHATAELREDRIDRRALRLSRFRGVDPAVVAALAARGITDVAQLLIAGRTPNDRRELAAAAGLPSEAVIELVQLSDLARIPGLKGIRARLYHDAGIETIAQLAEWDIDPLHSRVAEFVAETDFDGVAPAPGEVEHAVTTARKLPAVVVW